MIYVLYYIILPYELSNGASCPDACDFARGFTRVQWQKFQKVGAAFLNEPILGCTRSKWYICSSSFGRCQPNESEHVRKATREQRHPLQRATTQASKRAGKQASPRGIPMDWHYSQTGPFDSPATPSVEDGALLNHFGFLTFSRVVSTIAVSNIHMVPIVHQGIPWGFSDRTNSEIGRKVPKSSGHHRLFHWWRPCDAQTVCCSVLFHPSPKQWSKLGKIINYSNYLDH